MKKRKDSRVVDFPKAKPKDSGMTRLGFVALELGDMRLQIDRLRYDQQQDRIRHEKSVREIAALKKMVSELTLALSKSDSARPAKSPPERQGQSVCDSAAENDFSAALRELNDQN